MTIKNNDLDLLIRIQDTLADYIINSKVYDRRYSQLQSLRFLIIRLKGERQEYRERMRNYLRKKRQENPKYGRTKNERIS